MCHLLHPGPTRKSTSLITSSYIETQPVVPHTHPFCRALHRQPIHLHANRFWVLATGQGDLQSCLNADVDETLPRVRSDMFVMRYASEEKPQWIKFRAQVAQAGGRCANMA